MWNFKAGYGPHGHYSSQVILEFYHKHFQSKMQSSELNQTWEAKLKLTMFMLVHKNQSTLNIDYHLIKESHLIYIYVIILISLYHLQMDLRLGITPNLETPVWSGLTQICGRE